MKFEKNKKSKKNIIYKILSAVLAFNSMCFICLLSYLNLLPLKISLIIFVIVIIFNVINIFLINLKKLKKTIKKVLSIFIVVATMILTFANFYMAKTVGVFLNNSESKYKIENYSVIVLKDSNYNELRDIKDSELGYFSNSTSAEDAKSALSEKIDVNFEKYESSDSLVYDLLDSTIEVIMIEDSIKKIMDEEIPDFESSTKIIYTFSIKIEVETTLKEVDVTKESFAIYISGIDTYGEISSVSRSDVNMVMIVNPNINQILLISIPRDYYVQLHGTTGTKDKLTHAGIYGIDMSIQTIQDLLDIDINYYLKVNFTSLIDIVDALGGLDVYSEYSFVSYSGFKFKEGLNSVNGEQALDFARTRKAFVDGDRQRGKNQQAVIEAIIRKASDKSVITKYNSLLNAIDGKYQTNMSIKKITSLIKTQLQEMPNWVVTSYSLTGTDAKDYTYTYGQLLYVMKPDENNLSEAIELIDQVMLGEKLQTSYTDVDGTSNKVTQVQVAPIEPTPEEKIEPEDSELTDEPEDGNENNNDKNLEDENEGILLPEQKPDENPDIPNDENSSLDSEENNSEENNDLAIENSQQTTLENLN